MQATLYVIGIGPGDPELLTLKAARIIKEIPCICVPKGREEGSSLALGIVSKVIDLTGKEIIEAHFPMKKTKSAEHLEGLDSKWHQTAQTIIRHLNKGTDIAFITLGDPSFYSTFFYLYNRLLELKPGLKIVIIPGVSSINASAAAAGISLGLADEKIAILPATYTDNLEGVLREFDTVVLMKVNKTLDDISHTLERLSLLQKAAYISRLGMEGEVITRDIREITKDDLNYFSILIVKK
jgi:precorrin-2/cobalt-factor-2 C20-methyltransferase